MAKTPWGRFTLGMRNQAIIGKAVAYSDSADFKAFCADAVDGEIGIFLNTYAQTLVPSNALLAVTSEVFVALKRSAAEGAVEITPPFKPQDFKIRYTAYAAPVKQIMTLVLGEGSQASAVIQDITYTSKLGGTTANNITITYVVAGANTALSVAVVGTAITVNLATNGSSVATSTATLIKAAVDAAAPAAALVSAAITGTAATVQAAQATTALQGGTTSATLAKGTRFALTVQDKSPKYQPFPTYAYEVQANAGESFDGAVARLVTQINTPTSTINQDRDRIVNAVYTAATNTLVLTAIDFDTSFNAFAPVGSAFADYFSKTATAKMAIGSGTSAQTALYEEASRIGDGVTHNYPMQGTLSEDYGLPTSFVVSGETYDTFNFSGFRTEVSKHHMRSNTLLHSSQYIHL